MFTPDEANLKSILRGIPEQVLVVCPSGGIQYLNRAEHGYETEDFLGKTAGEILAPESQKSFEAAVDTVFQTGKPRQFEVELALPDGFRRWYRIRISPFQSGTVLVVASDIQELQEAKEEVAELRKLLPLCSWCGDIQDQEGEWVPVEEYLRVESQTAISHGLCPNCSDRLVHGADPDGGSTRNAG